MVASPACCGRSRPPRWRTTQRSCSAAPRSCGTARNFAGPRAARIGRRGAYQNPPSGLHRSDRPLRRAAGGRGRLPFLGNARVRRTAVILAGISFVTIALFANELRTWALRGQDNGQVSDLTGRTKVWSAAMSQSRPTFENWFGSGLSSMSFNGLPIDSNWVATFQDQAWSASASRRCSSSLDSSPRSVVRAARARQSASSSSCTASLRPSRRQGWTAHRPICWTSPWPHPCSLARMSGGRRESAHFCLNPRLLTSSAKQPQLHRRRRAVDVFGDRLSTRQSGRSSWIGKSAVISAASRLGWGSHGSNHFELDELRVRCHRSSRPLDDRVGWLQPGVRHLCGRLELLTWLGHGPVDGATSADEH